MTRICGIDEAGRGPIIGPLVMCGVAIEAEEESQLKDLGVKDSKLLTKEKREALFSEISKKDHHFHIVEPKDIDKALQSQTTNLNWLEADGMVAIIQELKPDIVYIDCPSTNPKEFHKYLLLKLKNTDIKLVLKHKADTLYPVVGAASILAKVTRDRAIEKIESKVGQPIGSGYPSDPKTKAFVAENFESHPHIFRKSWATYKNLVEKKRQRTLGDF